MSARSLERELDRLERAERRNTFRFLALSAVLNLAAAVALGYMGIVYAVFGLCVGYWVAAWLARR